VVDGGRKCKCGRRTIEGNCFGCGLPPARCTCNTAVTTEPPPEPLLLVTLHYPLPMDVVTGIMRVVAKRYPGAVIASDGRIGQLLDGPRS
jgi:hypothetical protein